MVNYAEDFGFQVAWFVGGTVISMALGFEITPFAAFIAGRAIADLIQMLAPEERMEDTKLVHWEFTKGEYDGSTYRVFLEIATNYDTPDLRIGEVVVPKQGGKYTVVMESKKPPLNWADILYIEIEVAKFWEQRNAWEKTAYEVAKRIAKGNNKTLVPITELPGRSYPVGASTYMWVNPDIELWFDTKEEAVDYIHELCPNVPKAPIEQQIPKIPSPPVGRQYLQISFDAIKCGKLEVEYAKCKAKDAQVKITEIIADANGRASAYEKAIKDFLAYSGYNDLIYAEVIKKYTAYNDIDAKGKSFSQRCYDSIVVLVAEVKKWQPTARVEGKVERLKDLPAPTAIGTDLRCAPKVGVMTDRFKTQKVELWLDIDDMTDDINLWLKKEAAAKAREFPAKRNEWTNRLNNLISDWNELSGDMRKLLSIGVGVNTRVVIGG